MESFFWLCLYLMESFFLVASLNSSLNPDFVYQIEYNLQYLGSRTRPIQNLKKRITDLTAMKHDFS